MNGSKIGQIILALLLLTFFGEKPSEASFEKNRKVDAFSTLVAVGWRKDQWSEAINELEKSWESTYEKYFKSDLPSSSWTASEIPTKLTELSQQTGQKTAVLWIVSRVDEVQLFLITPEGSVRAIRVPDAPRESLLPVIETFEQQLQNFTSDDYLASSQQLYQWLIAPINYYLLSQEIDTLILCVGPHLRSLPFAALHDGQKFLIEQYSLALIPGFNLTDWQVSPKPSQVLAMGASTFEDYPPLPSVSEEIRRISPVLWPGDTFLNEDFTVANLQNQLQSSQYSIIHLATHASFNSGSPTQSFIQFSDQALNLSEMEQLDWSAHSVNLLVLSACETALGNQEAELGFVGLAVHLGIKSALGSLWQVSDVGTLTIMDEFYWQLKQAPSKAEALRQAQLAMLKKQILLEGQQWHTPRDSRPLNAELLESQNLDLSHPFFWASFTLIGNPF